MTRPIPSGRNLLLVPLEHRTGTSAGTIGELLVEVSREAFLQERGFDPHAIGRPNWRDDMAHALILEGFLDGELDDDGNIKEYNESQFELLIHFAINHLSNYVYDLEDKVREEKEEQANVFKKYMAVQLMHSEGIVSVVGFRSTMMSKAEAENWLKEEAPQSPNREWVLVRNSGLTA